MTNSCLRRSGQMMMPLAEWELQRWTEKMNLRPTGGRGGGRVKWPAGWLGVGGKVRVKDDC